MQIDNFNYLTSHQSLDGYIQNTNASIIVQGDSTNGSGSIKLNCEINSHYLELKGPPHSSFSGNITYTLPTLPSTTGKVLTSDTNGNLDWVDQTSGSSLTGITNQERETLRIWIEQGANTNN